MINNLVQFSKSLGKGEVESSILSCSTIQTPENTEKNVHFEERRSFSKWNEKEPIPQKIRGNLGKIRGIDSLSVLMGAGHV